MTPGTGAGIGIALGLLFLFLAGPGAYYYRKRRRQQQSSNIDTLEAGDDYFGGVKPQLDDTAVSPETAWRISKSTIDDGPIAVSEVSGPGRVTPELDTSHEGRRPELSANITTPPPTELRADKSPPVNSIVEKYIPPLRDAPVESREAFAKSDDSIQLPTLPGPLLPPKDVAKPGYR